MSARPSAARTEPVRRRLALAPALLAAIALLVGVALIESDGFLAVRFVVAILALIMGWFAVRARQWWWVPPLLAIAVLWNPVLPIAVPPDWWLGAHYVAILVVVAVGALVKVPTEPAEGPRSR